MPKNQMSYQRLGRDVQVDQGLYTALLGQLQEARIAENVDDSGIVVIDKARVDRKAIAPRTAQVLLWSFLLSLLLGLAVAVGQERVLGHVGGETELRQTTGLPVLGMLPDWRKEDGAAGIPVDAPRHDPRFLVSAPHFKHSYYAESFKRLRTNLGYTDLGLGLRSLSVLSSDRAEGKTLTNANLALTLALAGKRVCLVDADLRSPSVHRLFGLRVKPLQGLPLLLSGQGALAKMVVPGPVPRLTLLPCGVDAPNPSELLGSPRLAKLVKELNRRYDYVVFDGAPILPVTDSIILASQLDGVLLLARFEQTRRHDLVRAQEHLKAAKIRVLGTVLNAVDMKKYSYTYGYGNRVYGYGQYEKPD